MSQIRSFLGILFVTLFLAASTAGAVQLTVDTDKISPELAAQILEEQKNYKKKGSDKAIVDHAKEWAGIGKEIGLAFAETARSLSTETNEFIKTPVGQWTLFFIAWYLIGHKMWTILAGIVIWVVLGLAIWRSFKYFHRAQRVLIRQEGDKKEFDLRYYPWDSKSAAKLGSAWAHGLSFGILNIIMIFVVL